MGDAYLWLKAGHIVAVIAWMAGILYLPRLFVYHCQVEVGTTESERFKVMERRLLRAIINPGMIASFGFGIALIFVPGVLDWSEAWIYVKLVCVAAMASLHGLLTRWQRHFAADANRHTERFYRLVNEGPAVLMVTIVVFVVVKPF